MVKAVAVPEKVTPCGGRAGHVLRHDDAGDGRIHRTMLQGWFLSMPSVFSCSSAAFRSACASFSASSACSSMLLRDGAVLIKVLGAHVGLVGHLLVVDGLQIDVECVGDVRALHLQQQLRPSSRSRPAAP